ncbi:MAG TPA: nucleotidyltransferase domain-containing protein [Nocardioidaceae bacterium]|nr:nucleotidyltransferase domain-containing protein [Nocardioidaceae bacterium]
MDLSNPIGSVVPSAHGAVLAVLARTSEPLSGRKVAELTDGKVGQWRTNEILGQLSDAGIVIREHRPPAKLYRLNRDHVAAPGILALAAMWATLMQRIRDELGTWELPATAACLFGSAARGEATWDSDIDILLIRDVDPASADADDQRWHDQVDRLAAHVFAWSGNTCEVLELSLAELNDAVGRDDRLVRDLRREAIALAGRDVRMLLRRKTAE